MSKTHHSHYAPITEQVLQDFIDGFPKIAMPSNRQFFKEKDEVIFATFEVLLSDQLLLTRPEFMHYVPSGRKLNKNSLQLQNHIAVLLRTPTKLFQICKMTEGRLHGQIVYRAEQLASIEEIEKGWNVLILIEKDPSIPLQLTRDVKENTTTLGYLFSSTAKQSIEN